MITKYPQTNNAAAKNSVRPSEGAAEGGSRGEFRRARAFRRSEAEAVSSVQKRFGFRQTNAPKNHLLIKR